MQGSGHARLVSLGSTANDASPLKLTGADKVMVSSGNIT